MTDKTRLNLVLATLCFCAFAVNVDVALVNIALPRLAVDLGASTRELQWIVGSYTLVFAALVLSAGSLSDRFGRRGALILGLLVYALGNGLAALTTSATALIATRAVMGIGAAIVFPTTLSIISNTFTERKARAKAIGLWGAATGASVALGPIIGGAILEASSWQATFAAKLPLAAGAIAMVLWVVPDSRDPEAPRLDFPGFALSTLAIGAIVYAVIEAPSAGWASTQTLLLGAFAAVMLVGFMIRESRAEEPMLDLRLFGNPRFAGASLSIAVTFFALGGFIFLIVQYFQVVQHWGPLEAGVRTLPVAIAIGVSSVIGTELAVRRSNKAIVTTGLVLLAGVFTWIAFAQTATTGYLAIAVQMVFIGTGMGLTSAPATESIMGAVSLAKAGVGSALNDMTRELGNTLGVAVVGSVFASLYATELKGPSVHGLPAGVLAHAGQSVSAGYQAVGTLAQHGAAATSDALRHVVATGFINGLHAGCFVVAGVCAAGALYAAIVLPAQPIPAPDDNPDDAQARNLALSGVPQPAQA